MVHIDKVKTTYAFKAGLYYGATILLIGFAIVSLVQGFFVQSSGNTFIALLHYLASALMVIFSYFSHKKASYKMHVLHMSRK